MARLSHLGSVRPAVCFTRPQYVLRSYWESGRSLLPGREADIVAALPALILLASRDLVKGRGVRASPGEGLEEKEIEHARRRVRGGQRV